MISAANSKRILIFSSSYPPVVGGVQTVTHNLAKQFLASGHEVRVVTSRYPVELPATENIDGVQVDRVHLIQPQLDQLRRNRPDLFLASFYYGPETYRRLRNIFREFHPHVVNVHFPDRQISPLLKLRKQFEFRLVVSLHGHDVERFVNGNELNNHTRAGALRNVRAILQSADAVTAVSNDLLDKALQIEPAIAAKSQVIHNGIDPERFAAKTAYMHPKPYILGLGRLVHKKGFDLLIDAFAALESQHKPDLIVAGDGDQRGPLDQQVQRLGLTEKVHFFGEASPDDAVRLLNGCLAVVVPSRIEPFGIVALEALAAGKPVVATETGGLREFLLPLAEENKSICTPSGANGHAQVTLVEPSAEGLARGLTRFLESRPNGSRHEYMLPERFTWPCVARSYERLMSGEVD